MSEIKLLPCPFCGSEDVLGYKPHDRTNGEFAVCCLDCDVEMYGKSKKATTRKWNTRKPMERILERTKEKASSIYQDKSKGNQFVFLDDINEIFKEVGGIE